jgi:hypothetical protein
MVVAASQRAAVVTALRSALNANSLQSVSILADETSQLGTFISEAPTWLSAAASSVGSVCHHNYGFASDSQAAQMGAQARNLSGGKATWFTEICCYKAASSSNSGNPSAPLTYSQGYE